MAHKFFLTAGDFTRRIGVIGACVIAIACSSDEIVVNQFASDSFWELRLNHRFITMSTVAPHNTIQLIATPIDTEQQPLTGLPAVTFKSTDPSIEVSSDGLVTAKEAISSVIVIASLRHENLTRVDTVFFRVTNDTAPPVLHTFSIQPAAGDSARVPVLSNLDRVTKPLTLTILDTANKPIPNVGVRYKTSGFGVASVDVNGVVTGLRLGTEMIYAYTTVYGVAKTDSLLFEVTRARNATFTVARRYVSGSTTPILIIQPPSITVGKPATITWSNTTPDSTDFVFEHPELVFGTAAGGNMAGNISAFITVPSFPPARPQQRLFTQPGVYKFWSTRTKLSGTIIVE